MVGKTAPGSPDPWSMGREHGPTEAAGPELEGSLVSEVIRAIYYQGPKATENSLCVYQSWQRKTMPSIKLICINELPL